MMHHTGRVDQGYRMSHQQHDNHRHCNTVLLWDMGLQVTVHKGVTYSITSLDYSVYFMNYMPTTQYNTTAFTINILLLNYMYVYIIIYTLRFSNMIGRIKMHETVESLVKIQGNAYTFF